MLNIYICTNVINLYFWSTFNYVGEKKRFFFLLLVLSVISLVRPLIFKWCWFDVMRPSILGQDTNPQRRSSKSINNRCVFLMWYKRCISIFLFVFCLKSKSREKKRERGWKRASTQRDMEEDKRDGLDKWSVFVSSVSKVAQFSHSLTEAWGSENKPSGAGILWWDRGMSHVLSMRCLCVYQSEGFMKTLRVPALCVRLQLCCCLCGPDDEPSSVRGTSSVLRPTLKGLVLSHSTVSSDTHTGTINKLGACPRRSPRALQRSSRRWDYHLITQHSTAFELKADCKWWQQWSRKLMSVSGNRSKVETQRNVLSLLRLLVWN